MRLIFEIPPDQLERLGLLVEDILPRPVAFIACAFAASLLATAVAALVYVCRRKF